MHTATVRAGAARRPASGRALFAAALFALAGLHAAMFTYDLGHPGRFLNADRAEARLEAIEAFGRALRGGDLPAFFASHGVPGDWLPHAVLYLSGGAPLVILVQVLLALASVLWVWEIGQRVGLREGTAASAAILYGVLPHSLVFPHQLASEAIFVPLVVLSFVLVLRGASGRAGAAMGLACLVRPITIAWPAIHALCAWRATPFARIAYLLAGLAPMALWVAFIAAETGEVSMGRSKHDLGHNLYLRVQRMAPELPARERFAERADPRISVAEYGRFVLSHPLAAAGHAGRDLLALGFKSGVERVVLDYLDLYPERRALQDSASGWRKAVEEEGLAAAMRGLFAQSPGLFLVSAAGALLFGVFMALAVVGAWLFLHTGRVMLVVFVAYILLTATVVDAAQSRHRAPAEFALCVLAAAAAGWMRRKDPGGR